MGSVGMTAGVVEEAPFVSTAGASVGVENVEMLLSVSTTRTSAIAKNVEGHGFVNMET